MLELGLLLNRIKRRLKWKIDSLMLIGIVTIEGYHCYSCPSFLVESGIDAIDPDCFGSDEYGNWDPERLGL